MPSHIAVIMDGNGRWAQERGRHRIEGHKRGVDVVREIITAADDLNIGVLTLYTFSTENWKRPKKEVFALMGLLKRYLRKETPVLHEKDVRVRAIGDLTGIPSGARTEIERAMEITSANKGLILNLAINYGARAEIIRAVSKIIMDEKRGKISVEDLSDKTFESYLDTAGLPDPDLLIRTGNEKRISNFLLWQLAYTEFWVTPVLWPEFGKENFYAAILDYQQRKRRFGGLKK